MEVLKTNQLPQININIYNASGLKLIGGFNLNNLNLEKIIYADFSPCENYILIIG